MTKILIVLQNLKINASSVATRFLENQMKMNEHKCHLLLIFGDNKAPVTLDIGRVKINQSKEEQLKGLIFYYDINIKTHIQSLCKNVGQKLGALSQEAV